MWQTDEDCRLHEISLLDPWNTTITHQNNTTWPIVFLNLCRLVMPLPHTKTRIQLCTSALSCFKVMIKVKVQWEGLWICWWCKVKTIVGWKQTNESQQYRREVKDNCLLFNAAHRLPHYSVFCTAWGSCWQLLSNPRNAHGTFLFPISNIISIRHSL